MNDTKKIEGFEDYLISLTGKVYSLKRNKYLRPGITGKGYHQVDLCKSGKCYQKLISRLVAQAFILNPNNKPEVNHKDGIKANNDVTNLEWCTHSENIQHAIANGLNPGMKPIPVNVYDYVTGKFLSIHPSQRDAARTYGLSSGNICNVLAGRQHQTGGLAFKRV